MKISIVGQTPIYVSRERGELIKKRLANGIEYFDINGNMYKASTITAITYESDPSQYGHDVDAKRLAAPKHERATEESPGFLKFQAAKKALLNKFSVS